jgi:CheY-like chemotaxis protein
MIGPWFKRAVEVACQPLLTSTVQPVDNTSILMVDDDAAVRTVMQQLLTIQGYKVSLADDGDAALDQCGRSTFSLILMDIQMPRMDGLKTTRILRDGSGPNANTPVMAITSFLAPDLLTKMWSAGMNDYLAKPIRIKNCLAKISHWCNFPTP